MLSISQTSGMSFRAVDDGGEILELVHLGIFVCEVKDIISELLACSRLDHA